MGQAPTSSKALKVVAIRRGAVRSLLLVIALVFASGFLISAAQDRPPAQTVEAKAAMLAASCSGCHVRAPAKDGFPSIYGRPAAEIRDLLLDFRSGEREGTVMNRLAKGYTDAEIELLSDFFAMQGGAQ
jgi:sulfide dehydrogenase cytochrome subunit